MKKISKNDDFIDILTGRIDLVKSIKYYTHKDKTNKISPSLKTEDNAITARIPASVLATLASGQLVCEIELQSTDSNFADGTYDTYIKEELEVWLV